MPDRPQKPGPEKVTEDDLFTPAAMVRLLVKGAEKRFRTQAEQLESLNKSLDAFDHELAKTPAHLRNQDPGAQFVEKAMGLLQAEIEKREPQRSLLPNQEQTREALP
jgi:acyl carrier protein phosphodiesterase